MILKETKQTISDATGLKLVKIFHLYGGFRRRSTKVGYYCKGSIKRLKKRKKNNIIKKRFKRGNVVKLYNVRQKYKILRSDGSCLYAQDNSCIMLKKKNVFQSKYLLGPGLKELKKKKFIAIFKSKM
jgi:ribosomal protein L14